jgi:hypothetical protein
MRTIALPGRHPQTEAWLRSLLRAAGLPVDELIRYRHWSSAVEASAAAEAERLADAAPSLVVAKSFGTVVAATAFDRHNFRPAGAVLIGTPYEAIAAEDLELLRRLARGLPTLFIQQSDDPGGPASRLATTLDVPDGAVAEVPGDDHLYQDVASVSLLIRTWITGLGDRDRPAA